MPSRTIEVASSTDLVGVDIDEHGQIDWDDELTTAYEYDVAVEAMGGPSTPLTEFMDGWNHNPILCLLLHFESKSQAIHAAADAIARVTDAISADPVLSGAFVEREALIAAVGFVKKYITGQMTHDDYEDTTRSLWRAQGNYGFLTHGHALWYRMTAATSLLAAIDADMDFIPHPAKPGRLRPGHSISLTTTNKLMKVFDDCSSTMGIVATGHKRPSIVSTDWYEAKSKWQGRQAASLAELVHASQLGYGSWFELAGLKGKP